MTNTTTDRTTTKRYFCHCVLTDGVTEVFIVVTAKNESAASRGAHAGYAVLYVMDVLTALQMSYRRRSMRPSYYHGQGLIY